MRLRDRSKVWRRVAVTGLVAVVVVATLAACGPVTPSVAYTHDTFEGYDVVSYVPAHPRALAFLFHGSYGSSDFAEKTETVDVLNRLVARGYGFVATSSTERTGDKRWDVFDPSLVTNPDLARLLRLRTHLVATTAVDATTPLVGIGMSNGARFVSLWAETWHDAGLPVAASWAASGRIPPPVTNGGGLTVPTFFTTAANDTTVPPNQVVADAVTTAAHGTPVELHVASERTLNALPYLRIDGIDGNEAGAVVGALVATGVWDASGRRVVADVDAALVRADQAVLPASVGPQRAAIGNETRVVLAAHQFSAEFAVPAADFFDRFVGP